VLKITHSAGESINVYYSDSANGAAYPYGHMKVGSEEKWGWDLAARVQGVNYAVSPEFFAVHGSLSWVDSTLLDRLFEHMADAGISWNREFICWRDIEWMPDSFRWAEFDRILRREHAHSIKALLCLSTAPYWASSSPEGDSQPDTLNCYAPQNLNLPVACNDTVYRDHYWAHWVYLACKRAQSLVGDSGFAVEIWNEADYWRPPKRGYEIPGWVQFRSDTNRYIGQLYGLLCRSACQAIERANLGWDVPVFIGGLGGVCLEDYRPEQPRLMMGKELLAGCYESLGSYRDYAGVSLHPYQYTLDWVPTKRQNGDAFTPDTFARDLDTIRNLMEAHDDGGKPLIATEISWSSGPDDASLHRAALSIPQVHVFSMAGDPTNFLDRIFWYNLYNVGFVPWESCGGGSLLHVSRDTYDITELADYYSYRQMTQQLLGKRLNGRVLSGIHSKDTCAYLYEFEDPATHRKSWIGWRNWELPGGNPSSVMTRIPARTNALDSIVLARSGTPDSGRKEVGTDGWLQVSLDTVPMYIRETGDTSRADVAVESLWTMPEVPHTGQPVKLYARVKNQGNAATPSGIDTAKVVRFYANGNEVGWQHGLPPIQPESSITCSSEVLWTPVLPGYHLLRVLANPKVFMELEFDDNSAYLCENVVTGPNSWLPMADVPAGGKGKHVKDGGSLASSEDGAIVYALKGNGTCEFYAYNTGESTWTARESIPAIGSSGRKKLVRKGAALAQIGGRVYAVKGNGTLEFWRYDPSCDSWSQLTDAPLGAKAIKRGAGAAGVRVNDTDYVYLLKGSGTREFYRCNTMTGAWQTMTSPPLGISNATFKDGSCLAGNGSGTIYALKAFYDEVFAYDVNSNSWTTKTALPFFGRTGYKKRAKTGAALACANGSLFALKGNNTRELWRYDVASDSWWQQADMPSGSGKHVKGGGALTGVANHIFALKGNNTLEFYAYYPDGQENPPGQPGPLPGNANEVLIAGGEYASMPRWGPTSDSVVFASRIAGHDQIFKA